MSNKDQATPLAAPPAAEEESATPVTGNPRRLPRRRCALWCCGGCGAILVLLGVTILVLALTVFKIKDPEMTMNRIAVDRLFVPGVRANADDNPSLSVNATLTADISIKNPNVAAFRFRNSSTEFFYGKETVGVAYAPDGNVRAYRTARMNVTVDVLTDRIVLDTNATGAIVFDGAVNMSSYTEIKGKVNVLGVYKQNLIIYLNCSFTLGVYNQTISDQVCFAHVK